VAKIPFAGGAPARKRKSVAKDKQPKSKGGRPRRRRPSEDWIKTMVRPWVQGALEGKEDQLWLLRQYDPLIVGEEAYTFLVAQAKQERRRVKRDELIQRIAKLLEMDTGKLTNWLNRSKRRR
jgi:hypothetical protein